MLTVNGTFFNQQRFSQLEEVGRIPGQCTSVNDQDEVGFASSKRCEHERRLTLNTDCIYRLRLVGERFIDVLHPVKRCMGVSLVQHPQPDLGAF